MPQATTWKRPHVEVGMGVHWRHGRGDAPSSAVVTAVGDQTVDLVIHVTGASNHRVRSGVRHEDDPALTGESRNGTGAWSHTPLNQRLLSLLDDFSPKPPAPAPQPAAKAGVSASAK